MQKPYVFFPMRAIVVCAACATLLAKPIDIQVSDPRPLQAAVRKVEREIGIAINFEEFPHVYGEDIEDITEITRARNTPEQNAAHPDMQSLEVRGGSLSLRLEAERNLQDTAKALEQLVAAHAAAGLPAMYKVSSKDGAFFVEPSYGRNKEGQWGPAASIMDTPIYFPNQQRSVWETVKLILDQISSRIGKRAAMGSGPLSWMATGKVTLGASGESARDILTRIFLNAGVRRTLPDGSRTPSVSYDVLYIPKVQYYLVSLNGVPSEEPSAETPSGRKQPPDGPNPFSKGTKAKQ